MRRPRLTSLLGEPAIRPMVLAQGISTAGTQVTAFALPALAVLALGARPFAAAALFATQYGAQGLAAPLLGVLVDSARSRRTLLVAADALHALTVALVPVAYWTGWLSLLPLFAVAAISGVLGGLTSIAAQSFVPALVPAGQLVRANSALSGARSAGTVTGLAVAGWLVQSLGGAVAVTVDVASYVLSLAVYLTLPRTAPPEPGSREPKPRRSIPGALADGWAALRPHPLLARMAIAAATLNLGGSALGGLYAFYAYRRLHVTPTALALIGAVSSVAAIVAIATAPRVASRLGLERLVPLFGPVAAAALLLIPAAVLLPPIPTLVAYEALFSYCVTVWAIGSTSLQQTLVSVGELGRIMAFSQMAGVLSIPVGALAGGALAGAWGVTPTMLTFALVAAIGATLVLARPRPRRQPAVDSTGTRPETCGHNGPAPAGADSS